MRCRLLLILPICLFLTGCSAMMQMHTIGYLDADQPEAQFSEGDSFFVKLNESFDNKLFAKQIRDKISLVLERKGYKVTDSNDSQYNIKYDAGINQGDIVERAVPVYNYYNGQIMAVNKVSSTLYNRTFKLEVYDKVSSDPIWIGETSSSGSTGNLQDVIDYLIVANFEQFGLNTNKSIETKVSMKSKKYLKILQPDESGN